MVKRIMYGIIFFISMILSTILIAHANENESIIIYYPSTETITGSFAIIDDNGNCDIIVKTENILYSTNYGYMIQIYNVEEGTQMMLVPSNNHDTLELRR